MKAAISTAAAAALLLGCGGGGSRSREYLNNDLVLAAGHAARDMCSCTFVMRMDEDYCRAYTRASPDVARYSIDREKKTVEASALVLWGARARYIGPRYGCVLE